MTRWTTTLLLLGGLTLGCEEPPAPSGESATPSPEGAIANPSDPAAAAPAEIPVPADFAAEAEAEIDGDTYEAALDALEAELDE